MTALGIWEDSPIGKVQITKIFTPFIFKLDKQYGSILPEDAENYYSDILRVGSKKSDFILKHILPESYGGNYERQITEREIKTQILAWPDSPKIYGAIEYSRYRKLGSLILMDKLDLSLTQLLDHLKERNIKLKTIKKELRKTISSMIKRLHNKNIFHNDLHLENIMIKFKQRSGDILERLKNGYKLFFIDFGLSTMYNCRDDCQRDFEVLGLISEY